METYDAVVSKRDVRHYTGEEIPADLLDKVLQAGRMAGSAKNMEANRFLVVRDQKIKDALVDAGDFSSWIGTSAVIIGFATPSEFIRMFDVGRQAQNMMVVAHDLGLATCPVTLHHQDKARAAVGLPEDWTMEIVLTMGWPDPNRPESPLKRTRVAMDDLVHNDTWS